ncbi:MAG TPA: carboxypeptidase regulatory-like domain-containing protein [Thermoplasmata archaeon]|nr:carboxypeptidase regulatory-like domain-containing protein [Thermoplasmata archaeon]
MNGSKIATLLVAVLMIASILYVVGDARAFSGAIETASIEEYTIDGDGDGRINFLGISIPVDVTDIDDDEYLVVAIGLWDETTTTMIASQQSYIYPSNGFTGLVWVDFEFSGRTINASGIDGPYRIAIDLSYASWSIWPPILVDSTTYDTQGYAHDEFETPNPFTLDLPSWTWDLIDEDDNGLYEWLRVNATIDAIDGDTVTIWTDWSFDSGPTFASTSFEHDLEVGDDQDVQLLLDGRLISGFASEDIAYWADVTVSTSDAYSQSGSLSTIDALNSSDFEPYVISIVDDEVDWEPLDVNDDGLTDFLKVFYNTSVSETAKYAIEIVVLNQNGTEIMSPQSYEGFLIEGYEQTIITFIDAYDLYTERELGPYEVVLYENPDTYNKWPNYTSIDQILLGNLSIDIDVEELNHPVEVVYVSGYVLDEDGLPISGADVETMSIELDWHWESDNYTTTDSEGFYHVDDITPGLFSMHVESGPGYFPTTRTIVDLASNMTAMNITLYRTMPENSTISGQVFDMMENPVADVELMLIRQDSGPWNYSSTDVNGNFSFNAKEGDYFVLGMFDDGDILNLSFAPASAGPNETVHIDMTLDFTIDTSVDMEMTGAMGVEFVDWNSVDMQWNIDFSTATAVMMVEFLYMIDLSFGNVNGYIDAEETTLVETIMGLEFLGGALGDQSGMYSLDLFCVDGIGYYVPADNVDFAVSDPVGPIFDMDRTMGMSVSFADGESYWSIADESSHDVYFEVDYSDPESEFGQMTLEVKAPEGFILTGTNDPANVTIDGFNRVTVTAGGVPDPDEDIESVLVRLTFSQETGEDTGSIHGYAVLDDEIDHSGIEVELLDGGLEVLDSVDTGTTGEFTFLDLEPGDYNLRGSMAGYNDAYASVTVVAGEMAEVELTLLPEGTVLETGTIAGTVVTQAGLPIGGASIDIFSPSDDDTVLDSAETVANGTFEFLEMDAGEYRLEISAYGFSDKTVYVLLNAGEIKDIGEIELVSDNPVGYVTGILHDTDGSGISGVTVEVRASGSDTVLGEDETDSLGEFLIDGLEDGDYNLTFILDGTVIGHADVTVVDFVGDAGIIVIDLASIDFTDDELPWMWILLILAIVAIVGVALAMKMRKPKTSQPMKFEEPPTDTVPVEEELPPPPPEY